MGLIVSRARNCTIEPQELGALLVGISTDRAAHTVTLLPNGKVLVAGGFSLRTGELASAELYDPMTGAWTLTGSLNIAQDSHTATLLENGKVLVAGGYVDPASAELYDPATGTWALTGSLHVGHYVHTATRLADGKVLVAGGDDTSTSDSAEAELYDPATGLWTVTGNLNKGRSLHTATLLTNGKVLIAGGTDGSDHTSAELYDPATGTWTSTGSLNEGRFAHTATLLTNGEVVVAGGYFDLPSAELYDSTTGSWTFTGSLNRGRYSHTATLLANGEVLVAGGTTSNAVLDKSELYDPGTVAPTSVKGSGFINGQGDQASFNVRATLTGNRVRGSFTFSDPAAGLTITDASIRRLSINGNSATFTGRADLGGGNNVTFNVSVADNGPGTSDTLSITVSKGYSAGGTLINGNIRIY